jgi:hypothetical protein
MAVDPMMRFSQRSAFKTVPGRGTRKSYLVGKDPIDARINAVVTLTTRKCILLYTNFFVTFLSWIYWLGTHAFNAAGHMGALL